MAAQFDPLKHKRGAHGKFTDMLRSLKPGGAVELPDGIKVKAEADGGKRKFVVQDPNGRRRPGHYLEAEHAARAGLNASAAHQHPDAIGGNKSYHDWQSAMEGKGGIAPREVKPREVKPARAVAAAPGGSHVAQQNAEGLRKAYPKDPKVAKTHVERDRKKGLLQPWQASRLNQLLTDEQVAAEPKSGSSEWRIEEKDMQAGHYQEGYHKERKFVVYGPDKAGGTVHATRAEAEADLEKRKKRHAQRGEARPAAAGKRDVAGPANKPKAGDLKLGQRIKHDEHGDMIYMGRNATNHHVARKANEPEGAKPRIIRLKNVSIGDGGAGSVGGSTDKPASPSRGAEAGSKGASGAAGIKAEKVSADDRLMRSGSRSYDVKSAYKLTGPNGEDHGVVRQEKEYEMIMEGRIQAGKRHFGTFWYYYPSIKEAEKGSNGKRKQRYTKAEAIAEAGK
jgi:hypothetical protein